MLRKYIMIADILLLGICLVSCHKENGRDSLGVNGKTQLLSKITSEDVTAAANNKEQCPATDRSTEITSKPDKPTGTVKSLNVEIGGGSMEEKERKESESFYYEKLSDRIKDRINGKSYKKNCDVPYEELRYVRVLYWGFDQKTHDGELIVNQSIAEDVIDIFKELYDKKYPIEQMVLVDDYDADDNASMAADNTSSFNYRTVDSMEHLSLHSYGLAIDINPLYNPYVRTMNGKPQVLPESGTKYADRTLNCSYYIDTNDACYKAFTKRGFTWGGDWKNSKDYQHFQKNLE